MFHRVREKSITKIAAEWDILASTRYEQITSGADITYLYVLIPTLLALIPRDRAAAALDAGCGIGFLTDLMTGYAARVTGVDTSAESIKIAQKHYGKRAHFLHDTIEHHSTKHLEEYDFIIANMVLMDVPNLAAIVSALYRVLRPGGVLIFSITHPCFWPNYYGYEKESWYRYDRELIIESPFRITARPDCPFVSTHIHRPLESYFSALLGAGFSMDELREPKPQPDIELKYPTPWKEPRYLVCRCHR